MNQNQDKSRDTFSVYFPEWLCERGFSRLVGLVGLGLEWVDMYLMGDPHNKELSDIKQTI